MIRSAGFSTSASCFKLFQATLKAYCRSFVYYNDLALGHFVSRKYKGGRSTVAAAWFAGAVPGRADGEFSGLQAAADARFLWCLPRRA